MDWWGKKIPDVVKRYCVVLGTDLEVWFETHQNAVDFAYGFNMGRSQHGKRQYDAQDMTFDVPMKNRGFRFSWLVKNMLIRHDEVNKWACYRAIVLTKDSGNDTK